MQFRTPQNRVFHRQSGRARFIAVVVIAALAVGGAFGLKGSGTVHWVRTHLPGYHPPVKHNQTPQPFDPEGNNIAVMLPLMDDANFERIALPTTENKIITCVQMGPDGKLYASTIDGHIYIFPIESDGTLGTAMLIDSLVKTSGPRLITGFCFEPGSTADHRVIWVDNGDPALTKVPDFTGRVTRISDPDLSVVHDVVTHLPRSVTDHQTNQPRFGPDGALYISQGCNTAYGGADETWGNRPERKLNGTVLRLDTKKLTPEQTIDALTTDGGGTFDPAALDSPLTIYACGIRNAYSLIWTTDGRLYLPTNGSSAGGNTPGGNGVPALTAIPDTEMDWLHRITPGRYYGHPNPQLGHFVLNGGNPGGKSGPMIVRQYPVGTQPDPLWTPAVYVFGPHVSANGVIEYLGNAFGGKLDHSLIVCRFNAGSDLTVLTRDSSDEYTVAHTLGGTEDMKQPLDVTEDVRTGFLYVSEFGSRCLTLLRPTNKPPTRLVMARHPNLSESQLRGQMTFNTYCINCHGPRGQGLQGLGVDLTSSQLVAKQSDHAIAEFVKVGRSESDPKSITKRLMPPNGFAISLDDQGRADVVAYVRALCEQAHTLLATTTHDPAAQ